MSSAARKAFDDWFTSHYEELGASAMIYHADGSDLLHNTYLRCVDAIERGGGEIKNFSAYFNRALWIEATRGTFKKLYTYRDCPNDEVPNPDPTLDPFERENALILTRHLAWFDRTVLSLYLDGYNIRQVARESGIPATTLYQSLHRSKNKVRNVYRQRTNKSK